MLSLRTLFDAEQAQGVETTVGFVFGEETFVVRVEEGVVTAAREAVDGAEVIFTGSPQAVAAAVHGKMPLAILEDAGALAVTGDWGRAEEFVRLFSLPAKAAP